MFPEHTRYELLVIDKARLRLPDSLYATQARCRSKADSLLGMKSYQAAFVLLISLSEKYLNERYPSHLLLPPSTFILHLSYVHPIFIPYSSYIHTIFIPHSSHLNPPQHFIFYRLYYNGHFLYSRSNKTLAPSLVFQR